MENRKSVLIEDEGDLVFVKLNRPEKRNALDSSTIQTLIDFFENCPTKARVVVITAIGSDFCSGADLSWMLNADESDKLKSSEQLVKLYSAMRQFQLPILTRVFGNVIAGGIGLVAASDIIFSDAEARFCIPEVRSGLVPAIMAPLITERVGLARFRELSLTGRTFTAQEALNFGLIDFLDIKNGDQVFDFIIDELLKGGPQALSNTKKICNRISFENWKIIAGELSLFLAKARQSPEAKEGIDAFFEHRQPKWKRD